MGDPLVDTAVLAAPNPVGDTLDFDLTLFPLVSFSPTALGPRAVARVTIEVTEVGVFLGDLLVAINRNTHYDGVKLIGNGVPAAPPVPEPGSLALLASGVAPGLGMLLRRRRGLRRDPGAECGLDSA
jgi:hypothetical protein